ncbi:CdaR family protein [Anaerotignum sp.]|uniref:CdaR family protein n=1 Tax=Anaerotignum sp. TaxID=2039241 RepID=UPI0029D5AB18|nr:CdaR family protein [Anaerotignum sp.]MCI6056736.1 CdaR family protein [Clostridia bacterium]MDY3595315.1 CdaR family protein [Anaerotignum sp.]
MKRFQELLMKDLGWKLLSVAIATTMWFMVISINQPIDTRSYSTTLQLVGEETLTARGLTVANREDLTNTKISIKVKAQRTALDRLSQRQADLISASVDLSDLTYAQDGDTITLPVETSVGGGATGYTVESKVPGSVEIQVETLAAKEFPLEVSLNGEVTEDTHLSTPKLIPETVMVKGAKSAVDSVVAVRLSVNAADAVQQRDLQVKPVAYDKDGNTVSGVTFSVDTVTVSYSLNEAKQVPVQVSVTGSPAEGYHMGEVTCTPKTVSVIGAKEDLDKLNVISLDQIDVSGATSSISHTFQLADYLPEGVKLEKGSSSSVQVLVHMEKGEEKTVTVSSDQIQLINAQDGYQYHLPESVTVAINGEAGLISGVEGSELTGQVDVSNLTEGEHSVTVDWSLPSGITAENSIITIEVTAVGGDESDTES